MSLSTAAYQALRAEMVGLWRMTDAPCWLCGQPIDYTAPAGDPDAIELDHAKPRKTHPHLTLDRGNCRPAHGRCNRRRGAGALPLGLGSVSEAW